MKKNLIFCAVIVSIFLSLSNAAGPATAANQGYTGAPGENGNLCSTCHTGGPFGSPMSTLTITDAMGSSVSSYISGETYEISLTAIPGSGSPAGYGFQLTILDAANNDVANFSNPSANAQIATANNVAGGRTYAEHDGISATNTFTFDWVAPSSGSGDLTFYYNVNLVNGTGNTTGDNGGAGFSISVSESLPPLVKVIGALEINNAFTLPTEDGDLNQVLTTDGAGNVSWMDAPTSFTGSNTSSDNARNTPSQHDVENIQKLEIDNLKEEVILLKSEIEALKKLIEKLTKKE